MNIEKIRQMHSKEGFLRRYCELLHGRTPRLAYETAETEYETVFAERKYASYDSFKVVFRRWHKHRRVVVTNF